MLTIATPDRQTKYVSPLYAGSVHDMTVFKNELSNIDFGGRRVHVDLGFQGIKDVIKNACVIIPFKKPKGKALDELKKGINKVFSSFRVKIENAYAGCKHFLINCIRSRVHEKEQILEHFQLSAALNNFKIKFSSLDYQ